MTHEHFWQYVETQKRYIPINHRFNLKHGTFTNNYDFIEKTFYKFVCECGETKEELSK